MSKIVLCDIDGTVANNDHRQHYLEGKKDWDGFFSELINDSPIKHVIKRINQEVLNGNEIIFITGRPERYRYSTNFWLKEIFSLSAILINKSFFLYIGNPSNSTIDALDAKKVINQFHIIQPQVVK